ncbi:Uroporphyrin-III C-methyltransferase [Mannheimia varigena USDA-ARS-USMARC-1388]|uniref:uroporphyrinogen-III C-methyltransferase n=1 Tax=Mannheimia varigena TaxID=85404 RepID=UPI0003E395B9|nr:uroporphyrinogen-III C-methyltransferase [Mannheimia varigena]AHG79220.1 Uroporphyrin-III C-methyltransferase [Mannheimia varigena USDA-ARS-USMARC-1388]
MSKSRKVPEKVENTTEEVVVENQQAVDSTQSFAKNEIEKDILNEPIIEEKELPLKEQISIQEKITTEENVIVQKSGGKGLALLALLVALAVGGAGHFMTNKKFDEMEAQIQALSAKSDQQASTQTVVEMPNFDNEKAQIVELSTNYQKALERIEELENTQSGYTQQISGLQLQLQKLNNVSGSDKTFWLLSEADFLLNNAARKVVLDNDIDTAKNLLLEADQVLTQVPSATNVREAIKADLNTLTNINNIDQNALMQRVANLTNRLDDLPILESEQSQAAIAEGQVSDSIADWEKNLEKSASSFLDHFIRISKRNVADEKAFVAPNQEIYLRENIRLRLQIAILAIPRQQSELYTKSLQTVGSWIRSYFDTSSEAVKNFLKEVDELADQTIYVDVPDSLQSLKVLSQQINKTPQQIEKVEIQAEKELEQAESVKTEEAEPVKKEQVEPSKPAESEPAKSEEVSEQSAPSAQ